MFLNEMNVQWMFAEHSREQSGENESSWMIKNVRKIPLAFSHIVQKKIISMKADFWKICLRN